jgi:hypothetical protein
VSFAPAKSGFKNPSLMRQGGLVANGQARRAVLAAGEEISRRNSSGKVRSANDNS